MVSPFTLSPAGAWGSALRDREDFFPFSKTQMESVKNSGTYNLPLSESMFIGRLMSTMESNTFPLRSILSNRNCSGSENHKSSPDLAKASGRTFSGSSIFCSKAHFLSSSVQAKSNREKTDTIIDLFIFFPFLGFLHKTLEDSGQLDLPSTGKTTVSLVLDNPFFVSYTHLQ